MGDFHISRCEIYERQLSRLQSNRCCADNNFRGKFFVHIIIYCIKISCLDAFGAAEVHPRNDIIHTHFLEKGNLYFFFKQFHKSAVQGIISLCITSPKYCSMVKSKIDW